MGRLGRCMRIYGVEAVKYACRDTRRSSTESVGGIKAMLSSFSRGEVDPLTTLIYDAREHAIGLIRDEAAAIGADDVVGIKTHIHEHANLLEFMAIGTAVKRFPNVTTLSKTLPPQAIIKDKDTWVSG